MANLRITSKIVAFGDVVASNNPKQKYLDWSTDVDQTGVLNPRSESYTIRQDETKSIFSGVRTTTIDGTTQFSASLVFGTSDRYRFKATSGTAPGFRTARTLNLSNSSLINFVVNPNFTVTLSTNNNTAWGNAVIGDIVWIQSTAEQGVTNPFSVDNVGFWKIIGMSLGTTLTIVRMDPSESYATETSSFQLGPYRIKIFSAAGVQNSDTLVISAGFSPSTQKSYSVLGVTSEYVEVGAFPGIPEESEIVPGNAGMSFFSSSKRYVHIEADQECAVRVNGDVTDTQRLQPWFAGDVAQTAEYTRTGPTWSLSIVNKSSTDLNVTVLSVE